MEQRAVQSVSVSEGIRRYIFFALGFFLVVVLLAAFYVIPQINKVLDDRHLEQSQLDLARETESFGRFVELQRQVLDDFARYPSIVNTAMLSDSSNVAAQDLLTNKIIAGEKARLVLQDIEGSKLVETSTQMLGAYTNDDIWLEDLLNQRRPFIFKLLSQEDQTFTFQISVPVTYRGYVEGVLSAELTLPLTRSFVSLMIDEPIAIRLIQSDVSVQTDVSDIRIPRELSQYLPEPDLNFVYIYDRAEILEKEQQIKAIILSTLFIGLIVTFVAFGVLGYMQEGSNAKADQDITASNKRQWRHYVFPIFVGVLGVSATLVCSALLSNMSQFDTSRWFWAQWMVLLGGLGFSVVTTLGLLSLTNRRQVLEEEVEQRTQELSMLVEKLNDSNEELSRFAYVCSHDLQEPLRMIRSFSERLEKHLQRMLSGDAKGKKYLNFITDGASRAQALISDILTYSSIDNDTKNSELVDIAEIVATVNKNMMLSLQETGASINCAPMPKVYGNKTQLFQLFSNLINNGIKYKKDGVSPTINVGVANEKEAWTFSIADNGIGIEEKHLSKIFDVFQRLHKKSKYAGTGIGLSICKKVVDRHGGKIWVESIKDEGSTFYFTLPKQLV